MRKITKIIIHCADTPASMDLCVAEINAWHKARGFESVSGINIGYHDFIDREGKRHKGRPDEEVGAHCRGQNSHSLGICLAGGKGGFNYTRKQMNELDVYIEEKKAKYPAIVEVSGHNEYSDKTCPNFNVKEWCKK